MAEELKNGMQCSEFDALVTDALDGTLGGAKRVRFDAHLASCPACSAMFQETQTGLSWLKGLPELEPPAGFVERVLIATSGVAAKSKAEAPKGWLDRIREYLPGGLRPVWAAVMQPRFAMSFGMAFFSITLVLNVTGVKLSSVRAADLHPSAIKRSYYEASGKLVKYYENIRFVYELETKVRDLKRAATPAEGKTDREKDQQNEKKGNGPEEQNNQNYSFADEHNVLANRRGGELMDAWLSARRRES